MLLFDVVCLLLFRGSLFDVAAVSCFVVLCCALCVDVRCFFVVCFMLFAGFVEVYWLLFVVRFVLCVVCSLYVVFCCLMLVVVRYLFAVCWLLCVAVCCLLFVRCCCLLVAC